MPKLPAARPSKARLTGASNLCPSARISACLRVSRWWLRVNESRLSSSTASNPSSAHPSTHRPTIRARSRRARLLESETFLENCLLPVG